MFEEESKREEPTGERPEGESEPAPRPRAALWQQALPWLITAACFVYLYGKLEGAAARQEMALVEYLANVFAHVDWVAWLALMVPYSLFFFLIDSLVVWRVIRWFNARIDSMACMPIPRCPS